MVKQCNHDFEKMAYERSVLFGFIKFKEEQLICKKCNVVVGWTD